MASSAKPDMAGLGDITSRANFPRDANNRVYHLSVKEGEVANRLCLVGSSSRAAMIAGLLDQPLEFKHTSHRGFTVYTGMYKGKRLSVIATGMGIPMTDFVFRETRAVVKGPMVCIRLGTCGSPNTTVPLGSFCVATHGSIGIFRNPDAFAEPAVPGQKALGSFGDAHAPYHVSKIAAADKEVSSLLFKNLRVVSEGNNVEVHGGLNASACSFYSSQGRTDDMFADRNATLIDEVMELHPDLVTLEMESFHMFDLARIAKDMRATACTIVLAQRRKDVFLGFERLTELERLGGIAVLDTLAELDIEDDIPATPASSDHP